MKYRTTLAVALAASALWGSRVLLADLPGKSPMTPAAQMDNANKGGDETAERLVNQQLRQAASDPKTASDKVFVLMNACDDLKEIAVGTLVQAHATDPQVQQLATMLVEDHRKAMEQLQPVSKALGIELPQQISRTEQLKLDLLAALPADDMQKEFVTDQEADHARDILKAQAVAQCSKDTQVKELAQQSLPMLQHHEEMAQQCAKKLGVLSDMHALTASAK